MVSVYTMEKRGLTWHEARPLIQDGDLLLFRGGGFVSWMIGTAGRSKYTHAGRAAWWGNRLFCVEVRELKGGRAVTLSSQNKLYPDQIDVFEAAPGGHWSNYDRIAAVEFMLGLAGSDYGYWGVLKAAAYHLPFVRCFIDPATDVEDRKDTPPFCSEACAAADRIGGGVDPVPYLADRLTEPGDLARSPFYKYKFTLI